MQILKKARIIFYAILAILLVGLLLFWSFQEQFILQADALPSNHKFVFKEPFEEQFFEQKNSDGKEVLINTLYFKTTTAPRKGFVFYLHGNSDNMQRHAHCAADFTHKGYDLFMMDYRGFGKSRGKCSEEAYHQDVQWIFEEVKTKYQLQNAEIIIYGRSLGTGMASYLASNNAARCLVLEAPYYNIADVPKSHVQWLPFPYQWFLRYTFRTDTWLDKVPYPTYIIHGTKDWIVPYKSGEKLKPLLSQNNNFITIPKAGHNNLHEFKPYHAALERCLAAE